ncbi:MAG: preprotein translocase subunit SecA [Clostridiales bacterium]|nr:preprotein translocase subunit SecA [Clostridiales bacterium]
MGIMRKLLGTNSKREVKKITPIVDKIESMADEYKAMTDEELRAKTDEFKARLAQGETTDEILPEAFATCREAADRVLGLRPYRVQLIGGIILHQGRIAEMKTGEGKTLVATLPAYLNALTGKGVHIVTVNDYLAKRDSEWMGKVYRFLGLTVGLIVHGLTKAERKAAYDADITYGTNNEIGFDYLRDNMAVYDRDVVQRRLSFAIVDEVDSILIDEARTPLIISGRGEESTKLYQMANQFAESLRCFVIAETDNKEIDGEDDDGNLISQTYDYVVEEKRKSATLTEAGIAKAEKFFQVENLADEENTTLNHHINQAIRAHGVMKKDIDYIVKDNQVIIVDEFTGRLMFGRRFNEGLHQAIEAKEGVKVANESKTLATITFQNFFRLYDKLSGMTGTAMTEEDEFNSIYNLDIVEIPTNKPVIRIDQPDVVYTTEQGKYNAIVEEIAARYEKGQPVLVGTVSIEKSERLSRMLRKRKIPHNVLNAKNHEKEAEIIAQAGKLGTVTVATNMAGRGTDIMLGGNAEYLAKADLRKAGFSSDVINEATGYAETNNEDVLEARRQFAESQKKYKEEISVEAEKVKAVGGLFILGTERHESRRIDNQLRGRSGRQGDPGESRFYLSLEDDVLRLFGSERLQKMMTSLKVEEDTPIDAKMLTKAIENAQMKVESRNFQIRKNVLDYDDVMNTQREVIYADRRKVLNGDNLKPDILQMITDSITRSIMGKVGENDTISAADFADATAPYRMVFLTNEELVYTDEEIAAKKPAELIEEVKARAFDIYEQKEKVLGENLMRELERVMLLRVVDEYWMEHLDIMDDLKQSIRLKSYGQEDPVVAYKREGFDMFEQMMLAIQEETVRRIFVARVRHRQVERRAVARVTRESHGSASGYTNAATDARTAGITTGDVNPGLKGAETHGKVDHVAENEAEKPKRVPIVKKNRIGRNDPCPCGSGKKWKNCHGKDGATTYDPADFAPAEEAKEEAPAEEPVQETPAPVAEAVPETAAPVAETAPEAAAEEVPAEKPEE